MSAQMRAAFISCVTVLDIEYGIWNLVESTTWMDAQVSVDSGSVPSTFESQPRASAADCPSGATVSRT